MSNIALKKPASQPSRFEIRVKEQIDEKWLPWFDEFTITCAESGETLLIGTITDQAALYGLIDKIRDLNLTLISVNEIK
jgi:hypothetical protein